MGSTSNPRHEELGDGFSQPGGLWLDIVVFSHDCEQDLGFAYWVIEKKKKPNIEIYGCNHL